MYYISSFLLIPKGSRVLPLLIRYASLAFPTLSLLYVMSSSGISVMSVSGVIISEKMFWDCGEFGDIRWVVNWSALFVTELELSNKRSGTRLKTESETGERRYGRVTLARFARVTLLRHALTISLLILRKKRPTVLQSTLFVERYLSRRSVLPMYCLQQWLYSTM